MASDVSIQPFAGKPVRGGVITVLATPALKDGPQHHTPETTGNLPPYINEIGAADESARYTNRFDDKTYYTT